MAAKIMLTPPPGHRWKDPLPATVQQEGEHWLLSNREIGLVGGDVSLEGATAAFWEALEVSLEHFVDADPATLSPSGLEQRDRLLPGVRQE